MRKGLFDLTIVGGSPSFMKSQWQEVEAVSHIIIRAEKKINANMISAQQAFSPFAQPRTLKLEMMLPTFRLSFPTSVRAAQAVLL